MQSGTQQNVPDLERIYQMVYELTDINSREKALLELSKNRETVSDLARIIWYSFGTITALLQEIVSIYPLLSPPKLKAQASNRVCNALALLQCVASHPETRPLFIQAHILSYLYPFLNTASQAKPFEYLRLTSLGVIGALVKTDDPEVIPFLLTTEIIPWSLRIMETGTGLSKTVALFIVLKILLDEYGLTYICSNFHSFRAVTTVLSKMVTALTTQPSPQRLLKHILKCYLRLCDNPRAKELLRSVFPQPLLDGTFTMLLTGKDKDDVATKKLLAHLLMHMRSVENLPTQTTAQPQGGVYVQN